MHNRTLHNVNCQNRHHYRLLMKLPGDHCDPIVIYLSQTDICVSIMFDSRQLYCTKYKNKFVLVSTTDIMTGLVCPA